MDRVTTLKEVLDNPDARAMVDAIEDTLGSLRGNEDDPNLRRMLDKQIDELEATTGFRYQVGAN